MRLSIASLLLLLLVTGGCVTSNSMHVGSSTYPPRSPAYIIDVYCGVDAPVEVQQAISNAKGLNDLPPNAEVVGRIDTNGAPAAPWAAVIDDAKEKARELGGDGIVIKNWGNPMVGVNGYGQAMNGKAISMEVVRYNP